MCRLWDLCQSFASSISELLGLFELDELYRRDCESFYETNGYGDWGDESSHTLSFRCWRNQLISVMLLHNIDMVDVFGVGKVVWLIRFQAFSIWNRWLMLGSHMWRINSGDHFGSEGELQRCVLRSRVSQDVGRSSEYCGRENSWYCVEDGIAIEKEATKAAEYSRRSKEQGHSWWRCNFAWCSINGIEIPAAPARWIVSWNKQLTKGLQQHSIIMLPIFSGELETLVYRSDLFPEWFWPPQQFGLFQDDIMNNERWPLSFHGRDCVHHISCWKAMGFQ